MRQLERTPGIFDSFDGFHVPILAHSDFYIKPTKKLNVRLATMELKDRILEAMLSAGLKKLQFANAVGVSSGCVTQWLNGSTKTLKFKSAMRMQQVTGYSADWLAEEKGEKMAGFLPAQDFAGLTPGAIEIAALYDIIPVSNRIKRVQAYNAATAAILAVIEPGNTSEQLARDQKKQSA